MGNTSEIDTETERARYFSCRAPSQFRDITISHRDVLACRARQNDRWLRTVPCFGKNSERIQYLSADHYIREVNLKCNSIDHTISQQASIVARNELCDDG